MLYNENIVELDRKNLMEIAQLRKISMQYFKETTTKAENDRLWRQYFKLRPNWNTRAISYPRILRLAIATSTVLIAFFFIQFFDTTIRGDPFLFFISSIMFSSWFGGLKSGFAATILSAAVIDYFFLPPTYQFSLWSQDQLSKLLLFILQGGFLSVLSHNMHKALF